MPYSRLSRMRSAYARRRAASRISRWYRRRRPRFRGRRRSKAYRSSRNKTSNVRLGKRPKRLTLKKRVKRLEISTKKHFDYIFQSANGWPIGPFGVADGTQTNESFTQMLAIQPYNGDNTIPPISGSAAGTERNCREGEAVFCTKVRLRGRILGLRPNDANVTQYCLHQWTDPVTGDAHQVKPYMRSDAIRAACQSRVHLVVLQDRRPSTINPVSGVYEPNTLPDQPQNPLQGLFQMQGLTTINSLETLGMDSALRNYHNNRFKVVHASTLQFDADHPSKWFDITINVNRKLQYAPPRPGGGAQIQTDPVNYNLLFYVSGVPAELNHAASAQFVMPNTSMDAPQDPVQLIAQPNLQMLSSRTYFREA